MNRVYFADNLSILPDMPSASIDLIYVDPPFNTGRTQARTQLRTRRDPEGDRTGFQGRRYRTERLGTRAFDDAFEDYLGFLEPRLEEAHRLLAATGSLYLHLDYREVHYAKVLLDGIFGRDSFLNEIIWAYDYGGRTKKKWPPKHDNILVYAKDPERYYFDTDEVERIPYMAPGLVGPEKAARGKLPTDTWWHTIVPTNGKERTGYPTQKPVGIARRIIQASCPPGGTVLDFFAGSGTVGDAAHALGPALRADRQQPRGAGGDGAALRGLRGCGVHRVRRCALSRLAERGVARGLRGGHRAEDPSRPGAYLWIIRGP